MSASAPALERPLRQALVGRCFMHPAVDYMLVGGGLSLLVTLAAVEYGPYSLISPVAFLWVLWFVNHTHFASSTVRLYAKPGSREVWPRLTMLLPLVALGVLTLAMAFPEGIGLHLHALYLTWSPFHYAAQAYGLAVMYSMRSGCKLSAVDKRLLRVTCLLAFFYAVLYPHGVTAGLEWLVPRTVLDLPSVRVVRLFVVDAVRIAIFAAPLLLALKVWRSPSGPMPFIALLIVLSNGVWWVVLQYYHAFFVATVAHGLQYLVIASLFHTKDQLAQPDNRRGGTYHTLRFYGLSFGLAGLLFYCLPWGYRFAGFGAAEAGLLVIAMINIHHFVVDAFIWRIARDKSNRRIVDGAGPLPQPIES